jgi:hypothetical protein
VWAARVVVEPLPEGPPFIAVSADEAHEGACR